MHPHIAIALTTAALCFTGHAFAINKCRSPDGKTVFQDVPCATGEGGKIDVKPASGSGQANGPTQNTPGMIGASPAAQRPQPQTEAQRIEAQADLLNKENRLRTLDVRAIPDARHAVTRQKARCDGELAALKSKKNRANNNLAGATWEQSISSEMAAVATRCDTESRTLSSTLEGLLNEQSSIKAALGK